MPPLLVKKGCMIMTSKKIANSIDARISLCFNCKVLRVHHWQTQAFILPWRERRSPVNFSGHPSFKRRPQKFGQCTVSKAFVRLMKHRYRSSFSSLLFFWTCQAVKTCNHFNYNLNDPKWTYRRAVEQMIYYKLLTEMRKIYLLSSLYYFPYPLTCPPYS